jgi:holo-[acyl-carrier protein] synthase
VAAAQKARVVYTPVVIGLGIDLVETERLSRALARTAGFEARVFTEGESAACAGRGDRVQALAARFAAKEACLKALGTGWSGGLGFRQVEVVRERSGPPALRLHGAAAARAASLGVTRIHVSLTHQPGAAAAVVVLERA